MHTYEITGANIVFEVFDGEVVIVNLDSGKYYSIRNTGAYVWNALMTQHSAEQITLSLIKHYPDLEASIPTDILRLVNELSNEGLIKLSAQTASESALTSPPLDYASPTVESYSDMQEILLLDPVHDVDESGWPIAQQTMTP